MTDKKIEFDGTLRVSEKGVPKQIEMDMPSLNSSATGRSDRINGRGADHPSAGTTSFSAPWQTLSLQRSSSHQRSSIHDEALAADE